LLAGAVAVTAVAAGIVVATTANAAIGDGTRARIMAKSTEGDRFYVMPTGELRSTFVSGDIYTFRTTSCGGGEGVCYEIQDAIGDNLTCMFYDTQLDKISYDGSCGTPSPYTKWRIDSLEGGGVRIRPVSHPRRCLVYDPDRLPDYLYTFIQPCAQHPMSHKRFWFVKTIRD
jgi:hypothetical protein